MRPLPPADRRRQRHRWTDGPSGGQARSMAIARVHNFAISLDGFGTGEPQSLESPFGHAGERLHEWMFRTKYWKPDGETGADNAFAERNEHGIGAEIMGANKFG